MKSLLTIMLFLMLLGLYSCGPVPKMAINKPTLIEVGFGPEDMLWDSISMEKNRILVSCGSRRAEHSKSFNGIYSVDPDSEEVIKLKQIGHPEDLDFHAHGFDMEEIEGQAFLFVINHEDEKRIQRILKYRINGNELYLDSIIQHQLLISPNDIYVLPDGSFFISNDAGKRGSKTELMLMQKKGSVVYFPVTGAAVVVDERLGMPNGLYFQKPYLYVSTSMQGKLFRYTKTQNSFTDKTQIAKKLPGADNLNPYKNGLLVPCHPRYIAFVKHATNAKRHSPSVVYYVSIDGAEKYPIFSDKGSHISCGSTTIIQNDYIYVSQIFEKYILKTKLK
jgi:hypothetical protein